MGYQVLARKWRPKNFHKMVGQGHVLQALINALDNNRLHHAYLFTGTRGVGKTTIARILAKCLNCERGVSSKPCGQCSACQEIDQGRFIDLIEVDAASRTKVEDTRDLLENMHYSPVSGRFKVYLIDEVHMLSISSFNALLKTLEEPPTHVKFLLATTDPQKLPVTVLSRCLQFSLKNIAPEPIANYLAVLLEQEFVAFEQEALRLLAKAARGSIRDALSLTDQAIAFGNGCISAKEVASMLGTIDKQQVYQIAGALIAGKAEKIIEVTSRLALDDPDFSAVLADLLSLLHRIALVQAVPGKLSGEKEAELLSLASRMDPEEVHLFYQIGLICQRDLAYAPDGQSGFEMALLKMLAFRPTNFVTEVANKLNKSINLSEPAGSKLAPQDLTEGSSCKLQSLIQDEAFIKNQKGIGEKMQAQQEPKGEDKQKKNIKITSQVKVRAVDSIELESLANAALDEVFSEQHGPIENFEPQNLNQRANPPAKTLVNEAKQPLLQEALDQEVNQLDLAQHSIQGLASDSPKLTKESLETANSDSWLVLCPRLSLKGIEASLANHCQWQGFDKQSNTLKLVLDQKQSMLLKPVYQARIEKVLQEHYQQTFRLVISCQQQVMKTPNANRIEQNQRRLMQVKKKLYQDPKVQLLQEHLSATLLEHTIVLLNPDEKFKVQ